MRKLLIVTAALAALGAGIYRSTTTETVTAEHDAGLVKDRVWIDHIPRSETDKVHIFIALSPKPRRPAIGIFEKVSMWEGHFEGFRYESHGTEMRIVFPQSGDKENLTLDATTCNQGRMDYCLEVKGSKRGVKRYYSRRGWEIRDLAGVSSVLTAAGMPSAGHSSAHR